MKWLDRKENFSGRLRELRIASGLSQQQVADDLNITQNAVFKLELGQSSPAWETVLALADRFGVSPNDLLDKPAAQPKPSRGRPRKTSQQPAKR